MFPVLIPSPSPPCFPGVASSADRINPLPYSLAFSMLENLITQIACNLSLPATPNAPVRSPLSHFNISLQHIHRQRHIHLLCFLCQKLTKSLGIFIFNQTRKHYCFPHSAHEVIPPFGLPSLHFYCTGSMHCCWIHTNHSNLCTDTLSEHAAL